MKMESPRSSWSQRKKPFHLSANMVYLSSPLFKNPQRNFDPLNPIVHYTSLLLWLNKFLNLYYS